MRQCKAVSDITVCVCMLTDTLQPLELQRFQREKGFSGAVGRFGPDVIQNCGTCQWHRAHGAADVALHRAVQGGLFPSHFTCTAAPMKTDTC